MDDQTVLGVQAHRMTVACRPIRRPLPQFELEPHPGFGDPRPKDPAMAGGAADHVRRRRRRRPVEPAGVGGRHGRRSLPRRWGCRVAHGIRVAVGDRLAHGPRATIPSSAIVATPTTRRVETSRPDLEHPFYSTSPAVGCISCSAEAPCRYRRHCVGLGRGAGLAPTYRNAPILEVDEAPSWGAEWRARQESDALVPSWRFS